MTSDLRAPIASPRWRNWSGHEQAVASDVLAPGRVEEVAALVKSASETGRRIKVVGSGHSFNSIAVAEDQRMHLNRLAAPVSADGPLVTVPAGTTLATLNAWLAEHGLAVPNLGDIDSQTVAGAIATGTHGTGLAHSTLASCVAALTLVAGDGSVVRVDSSDPIFPAARLGLGALGVVVDVTLRCVDAFTLCADERPMPLAEALARLDDDLASNEHVEFYWHTSTDWVQLKRNNTVPADDRPLSAFRRWLDDDFLSNTVYQGVCRLGRAIPATVPTINAVAVRALAARTYTGRSDQVFCTPRRVRFNEMEYEVPRAAMPEVMTALRRIVDRLPFKVQFPVEVRFTGPDDVWLSHGYGRESAYFAVQQFVGSPYEPYFRAFEAVCAPLGGRPHWGKLHYRDADSLRAAYPRFDDFLAVRDRLDPGRVFTNAYLDRVLGR
ncbi:D-arabinono-1,4-lactone oxidase [Jidongwangia harbinensis]|uniref:D-arabinono-1,4-lactone oxidase n=1 Tax=Jidongwangia harbinensis TaxID=2878561 RepID=UPI001CD9F338|nr:D-arabinono-1,4-lactone oxidase [Jidongwangia harbinensis]MCA2214558.1 FAD-binding protein [Jidongwangia harbinensis]